MKIATRIDRMIDKPDSKLKATASVTLDGLFAVHGIRVVDTEKGLRAMMPSTKYEAKNGETKYSDIFHAITPEGYTAINQSVLGAYNFRLEQAQKTEVEITAAPASADPNGESIEDSGAEFTDDDAPPLPSDEDLGVAL